MIDFVIIFIVGVGDLSHPTFLFLLHWQSLLQTQKMELLCILLYIRT